MVFSSLVFLFGFLPLTLFSYYITPNKHKNLVLLISGLIFYAWGEPVYVLAMIFSTMIDYTAGRMIAKHDGKPKLRRLFLLISIIMNLSLLGVFKYLSFFIATANNWFGASIPDPRLPLPVGISFFIFQSMSYTIDVYRRKIKVQKSAVGFAAFVTMFPQIVAGPIVRYEDVENEIGSRSITIDNIADGISRFIVGLGKKVIIANNIGLLWTQVKACEYGELSAVTAWLGITAFAFQIYFDFSGYSDMAIGLGKMLGFTFPENFNYPYLSCSISEFWRRWHITLGSWFREYLYIPLGGNRKGALRTVINLLIVWAVTGLWHGASWNFIIWGIYFGIIIMLERLFLGKILKKLPKMISRAYTFILVLFGWILFDGVRPGTVFIGDMFSQVMSYIGAMFGFNGRFFDTQAVGAFVSFGLMFAVCIVGASEIPKNAAEKLRRIKPVEYLIPLAQTAVMLISVAYIANSTYNPFLYFNF